MLDFKVNHLAYIAKNSQLRQIRGRSMRRNRVTLFTNVKKFEAAKKVGLYVFCFHT